MASENANPWYDRLKELYYREPFEPFVIRTKEGKTVHVILPMHIMFAPTLKTIYVAEGPGEGTTMIDSASVVEVAADEPKKTPEPTVSPERIRLALAQKPFQPFTIHMGDGGHVDVLSPEFAYLYPGGRTLLVSVPLKRNASEEGDFEEHRIDVFLITRITSPPSRPERTSLT
jgi:hypothetical protein